MSHPEHPSSPENLPVPIPETQSAQPIDKALSFIGRIAGLGGKVLNTTGDHLPQTHSTSEQVVVSLQPKPVAKVYSNDAEYYTQPTDKFGYIPMLDIQIKPESPSSRLSTHEVARRMETDRVVKHIPRFKKQTEDTTRTNGIVYIGSQNIALADRTSHPRYMADRTRVTEWQALNQTYNYLSEVAELGTSVEYGMAAVAKDMRDKLSFLGDKERSEASKGIADYWKSYLNKDENNQLLVVVGKIDEADVYSLVDEQVVKSDECMLNGILEHFTDEELVQYGRRLTLEADELTAPSTHTKVALLDDWTLSGLQMSNVAESFLEQYPQYKDSLEIQLAVATTARIKKGLPGSKHREYGHALFPVRAYYVAHESAFASKTAIVRGKPLVGMGAHITGAHSSADYDFEATFADMIMAIKDSEALTAAQKKRLGTMPALTNIVRPYREQPLERLTAYKEIVASRTQK